MKQLPVLKITLVGVTLLALLYVSLEGQRSANEIAQTSLLARYQEQLEGGCFESDAGSRDECAQRVEEWITLALVDVELCADEATSGAKAFYDCVDELRP